MEDKWFSETKEGAHAFTEKFDELNHVVEGQIPKSVYDRAFKDPNIDNTGPGFVVPEELLPYIKPVNP